MLSSRAKNNNIRLFFFMGAFVLYGLFGSPTPDNPGLTEGLIFISFLIALGLRAFQSITRYSIFQLLPKWELSLFILFVYGLFIPVFVGLNQESSFSLMVRDIIPFLFLCLPLFFMPFLMNNKKRQYFFLGASLFVGFLFSLRVLFLDFSFFSTREELLYLANSPLVLFTGLYFCLLSLNSISINSFFKKNIKAIIFALISIIPFAAMYIDFQRASFLALGISISVMFFIGLVKYPVKMLFPILVLVVAGIIFSPHLIGIVENISVKTSQVGLNMRLQELMAVWDVVADNSFSLLFGRGWGASFASPAVGGLNVTYTHSLLTYVLLKMGLIGLGLTLIYLFFIFEKLIRLVFIEPVKGNALIWSFIIPILLYASYKSLDYGVILVLILVVDIQTRAVLKSK